MEGSKTNRAQPFSQKTPGVATPSRPAWWVVLVIILVAVELGVRLFVFGYQRTALQTSTSPILAEMPTILCLGDSNTFGLGAKTQDSYPRQLEQLLLSRWPERRIQVINRGIPSFNSSQVLDRLPDFLEQTQPDFVLLMVGANDAWNFSKVDDATRQLIKIPLLTHLKIRLDRGLSYLQVYRLAKLVFVQRMRVQTTELQVASRTEQQKLAASGEQHAADPQPYLSLAWIALQERKLDQVVALASEAIRLAPESAAAYDLLGRAYRFKQNHEQSEAMMQRAIELDPTILRYRLLLAELYRDAGRIELEREARREAFRLVPEVTTLGRLGLTYSDPEESRAAMRSVLEEAKEASQRDTAFWQPYETLIARGIQRDVAQQRLRANLKQIADDLLARNIRIGMLTYPNRPVDAAMNRAVRDVASRHPHIMLIDAAQALSDRFFDPSEALLSADRAHPNVSGYGLLARYVIEALDNDKALEALTPVSKNRARP